MRATGVAVFVVAGAVTTAIATVAVEHRIHARDVGAPVREGQEEGAHHEEHDARAVLDEEARRAAGIETRVVGGGEVWETIRLPGEVALNRDALAKVSPRVSGTVREINKRLGDEVAKGEVLAVLESRELVDLTRDARATAERLELAESNFKRVDRLFRDGVLPEKDQLRAKTELEEARIARDGAGQALLAAGASGSSGKVSLIAPIAGRVIERHLSVGEVLKDDSLPFVVADLTTLWVELTVYARDLSRVEVGQSVRIVADGIDEPATGTVAYLGATASHEARATQARVVLRAPSPRWKPGLFVSGEVAVSKRDVRLLVPDEAIQTREGRATVFVEEDGSFEPREVKVGARGLSRDREPVVEVTAGLAPGETFVSANAFIVKAELGKSEAAHED